MKKNTIIKKYRIAVFALFCVHSWLLSTTITIKQDGSGDFTTIQAGIEASSDADTILVHPGTYYENINYVGKNIIVASLYLTTGNEQYVSQTIIDGNQQARCATIENCSTASLIGFTIQNGYANDLDNDYYTGGGVSVYNVPEVYVTKCIIKHNTSVYGGGICTNIGAVYLKGNTIAYNHGLTAGGGLFSAYLNGSALVFDETDLNNVYLNFSGTGSDIFIVSYTANTNVVLDTFTVANPDYFFINHTEAYSFSSLHAKMEEVDHDLYVSPDGSDENTGITADDPLQTIARAQLLIKRNDANPHTIHLAPGEYSPSLNNQRFPLNVKHGVTIQGESSENTILNAEDQSPILCQFSRYQSEFSLLAMKHISIINGNSHEMIMGGGISIYQADIHLNDVVFENCQANYGGAILIENGYSNFDNIQVMENIGGPAVCIQVEYQTPTPTLQTDVKNSRFNNNLPYYVDPDIHAGGALSIQGHDHVNDDYYAQIVNCEFIGNYTDFYNPLWDCGGYSAIFARRLMLLDIANCTFGDNIAEYIGSVISIDNSHASLFNSIVFGNDDDYSLSLWENTHVDIYNSLIEGAQSNIHHYFPQSVLNWHAGSFSTDPLWLGSGDYPYMLSEGSPCIDAGTMDLPAGIELPEFDLAGNPRISGDSIDIGAYEYQDSTAVEPPLPKPPVRTSISSYPNPFRPSASRSGGTTIMLELVEEGPITVDIYNIKGQKVLNLMDSTTCPGTYKFSWNGRDAENRQVASGQYFVKVVQQGQTTASKMVMLK